MFTDQKIGGIEGEMIIPQHMALDHTNSTPLPTMRSKICLQYHNYTVNLHTTGVTMFTREGAHCILFQSN